MKIGNKFILLIAKPFSICRLTNQIYIKDQQINELAHKLSEYENKEKEMTEENETLRVKSAELEERVI